MPSRSSSLARRTVVWSPLFRVAAAALIVLATISAYAPAVRGGFIWDDDAHVTKPALRSVHGLYRIWFDVGATQQYYPLVHSAFWLEHKLWGDSPPGYHVVNIVLHAGAAVLVLLIARRLLAERGVAWAEAGAFLTAAVFALHPVQVESVAWITELKNTLSAVFYLAALLTYLRFDRTRNTRFYLLATALFVLGLLSKTVTATLPAALLVIFWWQRGRLAWKRDVAPLLPWFVLGVVSGLFTAWVEHNLIGAQGQAFELSAVQRLLLAGRVVWFYLSKLAWPAELIFIYPRWSVNAAAGGQWLFPAGLVVLLVALLALVGRSRAPLAALLFFVGTLFPVLGFFNVYPFLYSFVADHFQYLASLGIVALACSGVAAGVARIPGRIARTACLLALPLVLGVLTFRQSQVYANSQTLYETTIRQNPACWMAYNNLGIVLKNRGLYREAVEHYRRALQLRPDYPEAHNNLGIALSALGRPDEAITAYQEALRLRPANPEALGNLANTLTSAGRYPEAVDSLQQALRFDPHSAGLHFSLGATLQATGRLADAVAEYRRALELDPAWPGVRQQLELAQAATQTPERAIATYEQVLRSQPDDIQAHFALAVVLAQVGRVGEAVEHYQQVVRMQPGHVEAHSNLASLLARAGRLDQAIPHFEQAVRLRPDRVEMHMNLAVAYSSAGRFPDALAAAQRAQDLARSSGQAALAEQIEAWIASHRTRVGAAGSSP
jgi:tetratricopeptide (TPR) repeat protein